MDIQCPSSCGYLAAAREHPAAVVRRQQEQDVALLLPTIQHLTERQYQLFFLIHTAIARHKPEGFARLIDSDVADAAAALASTYETAARGVIYAHAPQSRTAQSLGATITGLLTQLQEQGTKIYEGEIAIVLRAIGEGAGRVRASGGGDTAYIELLGRLLQASGTAEQARPEPAPANSLILP